MGIHDGHRKRLRDRFRKEGLASFEDHNCLELLLFYSIPQKDTNPIAHKLLEHFGSLSNIFSATIEELCEVEGITENSAVLISMLPQLMKKVKVNDFSNAVVNSADVLCKYCKALFEGEVYEKIKVICLDNKLKVIGCDEIGSGTTGRLVFDLRKIVETAIKYKSDMIVIAHNHPKNNSLPSNADISATNMIKSTLQSLDMKLLDHIIVGEKDVTSLRDSGYMFDL